jgi:hypothetical protein
MLSLEKFRHLHRQKILVHPDISEKLVITTVPEIIDPVFAKTSQNARFLLSENERFGLVFVKTGSINSGTVLMSLCCKFGGTL